MHWKRDRGRLRLRLRLIGHEIRIDYKKEVKGSSSVRSSVQLQTLQVNEVRRRRIMYG